MDRAISMKNAQIYPRKLLESWALHCVPNFMNSTPILKITSVVCCCSLNKTQHCDEHLFDKLAQTQVDIN